MIPEALQYAASLAVTPADFRRHVSSSVRLWARAKRCKRDWATHEANTKSHILHAVSDLKQRRTAVVLGSGLLRDVPMEGLVQAFDTVVLVDLVHLASVRAWVALRGKGKVRLTTRDVSGLEDALKGERVEPLAFLRQVPYLDFVASTNLLSQIGVGARRKLEKRPGQADLIVPQLIHAHLTGLSGLPCKACLVTDVAYQVTDRQGKVLETGDLLAGIEPPPSARHWNWPVVPFGEDSRDYEAVHRVIAV